MSEHAEQGRWTDLLTGRVTWRTWSPCAALEPAFGQESAGGLAGGPALRIAAGGSHQVCGCWRCALEGLTAGRRYRIEAACRVEDLPAPGQSVRAVLAEVKAADGDSGFYDHLDLLGYEGGWRLLGRTLDVTDRTPALNLDLFLATAQRGTVRWSGVRLRDVSEEEPVARKVRLAAISGGVDLAGYLERLDRLGREGVDLVCLSETINPADEPIPGGPWYEAFAARAKAHRMYVAVSLKEADGAARCNTGVLIDRQGRLVGKYRKTHLTPGEQLYMGRAPGDAYPVFETDFAKVGFMICYDFHYPEVARIYSLSGAELLLNPNAGDGREGGILWEHMVRARAVDNQVHLVAATNRRDSCVVSPKGRMLAMADGTPGAIAAAVCDLNESVADFTGRPIRRRYDLWRRADTYGPLARHLFDAEGGNA